MAKDKDKEKEAGRERDGGAVDDREARRKEGVSVTTTPVPEDKSDEPPPPGEMTLPVQAVSREERRARREEQAKAGPGEGATDREAVVVAQNARAMEREVAPTIAGRTGVVKTDDDRTIVQLGVGEYATTPLDQIPSWYLAHLMGDAVDNLKWRQLTREQQDAIAGERDRRQAMVRPDVQPPPGIISDLETPQERRAKAAAGIPVSSGAQAPTVGAASALARGTGTGTGEDVSPPPVPPPPGTDESTTRGLAKTEGKTEGGGEGDTDTEKLDTHSVADLTVDDARELISKAKNKRELNSIMAAEKKREGGPRAGVEDAVERRRAQLDDEKDKE